MKGMNQTIKPAETKVLGWYAVRWAHITDWVKTHGRRDKRAEVRVADIAGTKEEQKSDEHANKQERKLHQAVKETRKTLATARSVFPFELFPDLITIDQHKLTIEYRSFFGIKQTVSVPIENVKNIQADLGPFFGSIIVTSDHFINNTQTVNWLWRNDAEHIQKLVQGIMVAVKEGIDLSKVEVEELKKDLTSLGEGRTDKVPNGKA